MASHGLNDHVCIHSCRESRPHGHHKRSHVDTGSKISLGYDCVHNYSRLQSVYCLSFTVNKKRNLALLQFFQCFICVLDQNTLYALHTSCPFIYYISKRDSASYYSRFLCLQGNAAVASIVESYDDSCGQVSGSSDHHQSSSPLRVGTK